MDDLHVAVGHDGSLPQPVDVGRHADHAVGVVPGEVRLDEMARDPPGLCGFATGGGEDGGDEPLERDVVDPHDTPASPCSAAGSSGRKNAATVAGRNTKLAA